MGACDAEVRQLKVTFLAAPEDWHLPADGAIRVGMAQFRPGQVHWPWLEFFVHHFAPHVLVLPEYVWYGPEYDSLTAAARAFSDLVHELLTRTRAWDCVLVPGTLVERWRDGYRSHAFLVWRGTILADYMKINPTRGETSQGLRAGQQVVILDAGYLRMAPLICADIFCAELFDLMRAYTVNLVVLPTASPYRPAEPVSEKFQRDRRLYQAAARRMHGYLVKVCGVGSVFGTPLQGRSLVAGPDAIVWRVPPEAEAQVLLAGVVLPFRERHGMSTHD